MRKRKFKNYSKKEKSMLSKLRTPLMLVGALLAGVMFADQIKPVLAKLPAVGGFFADKVSDEQ